MTDNEVSWFKQGIWFGAGAIWSYSIWLGIQIAFRFLWGVLSFLVGQF